MRSVHIAMTALLAATYSVLVPLHVAWEHGHAGHMRDARGRFFHVHDPHHGHGDAGDHACDDHARREVPIEHGGRPALRESKPCCAPHEHDSHAHSLNDHGAALPRTDRTAYHALVLARSCEPFFPPAPAERVPATESPPAQDLRSTHLSLRGPPVG